MTSASEDWVGNYRAQFSDRTEAAKQIALQLEDALSGRALGVQQLVVRAKSPESVAEKMSRKNYSDPDREMTDLFGARIIMLFEHSGAEATRILRQRFPVVTEHSIDKTLELGTGQVGYRSTHLVIRPSATGLGDVHSLLRRSLVEVQIRSAISHAWAEIEHSYRYKAGSDVPAALRRRFDALAGTLELVDREFSAIALGLVAHVNELAARLDRGEELGSPITALTTLAALKSALPESRSLGQDGLPLEVEDAYLIAEVLEAARIANVGELINGLRAESTWEVLREYEDLTDNNVALAPAYVHIGALLGTINIDLLQRSTKLQYSELDDALEVIRARSLPS